jgi:hypothetical protein
MNFQLLQEPWFWVVFAAASELIGMNKKLSQNSVIELVLKLVGQMKPRKKGGRKGDQ